MDWLNAYVALPTVQELDCNAVVLLSSPVKPKNVNFMVVVV